MQGARFNRRRPAARGFTLVEALVAISIAVIASSALSLGITSALQNVDASLDQAIASGIAQQRIDEVLGARYADPGSEYATPLGPSIFKQGGAGRERYTDSGDYNGFAAQPCQCPLGSVLGRDDGAGEERHPNFFAAPQFVSPWREEIEVYYVSNADPSVRLAPGETSDFRAVEVRIFKDEGEGRLREVTRLRRVIGYVPTGGA